MHTGIAGYGWASSSSSASPSFSQLYSRRMNEQNDKCGGGSFCGGSFCSGGPFVTGTFSDGSFCDGTFCDGSFSDGSLCRCTDGMEALMPLVDYVRYQHWNSVC